VVVTSSFLWAQAPKLKALAKTAKIMIAFKNFNSISPPFSAGCSACLGNELQGSNAFLIFFDCLKGPQFSIYKVEGRETSKWANLTTGAFRDEIEYRDCAALHIRTHPWLAGLPILSWCVVP